MINKAVILAGGRGTRFLPYTKACAKEMINLVDKPALQYIVEECAGAGIKDILIIDTKDKPEIAKHFSHDAEYEAFLEERNKQKELDIIRSVADMAKVTCKHQDKALGSGHAVMLAEEFADGQPFAVLNGDDLMYTEPGKDTCIGQIASCFDKCGTSVIGVQEVSPDVIYKYSSCDVVSAEGRTLKIKSIIEKPAPGTQPSNYSSLGRYVCSADFFSYLRRTPFSASGEIYLTDAFKLQAQEKGIYAYVFDAVRYDTGDKLGYLQATVEYALRDSALALPFKKYLKEITRKL